MNIHKYSYTTMHTSRSHQRQRFAFKALLYSVLGLSVLPLTGQTGDSTLAVEPFETHPDSAFEQLYRVLGQAGQRPYTQVQWPDNWPPAPNDTRDGLNLRLFHLNDLHNKVVIPDAQAGDTRVMAQVFAHLNKAREQGDAVLFLSGGDDHTGEVYDELLGTDASSFQKSLAYHAYSGAGMDAAVLGNHEFDRGAKVLQQKIRQNANFPLLSANIQHSDVLSETDYAPAIMGTIAGWRVGIIGLTSTADTKQNLPDDPEFTLVPELEALDTFLPALTEQLDLIIALTHVGYGQEGRVGDEDVAQALAQYDIPALVVGGHSHTPLHDELASDQAYRTRHKYDDVLVVQAGSWGEYLGEVQLELTTAEAGSPPELVIEQARLLPITAHDAKRPEGDTLLDHNYQETVIDPVLADFAELLDEPLARVADDPQLSTEAVHARRYTGEMALANFMTDAILAQSHDIAGPAIDLVAANASGMVAGVPPGETISFATWYGVMPYADTMQRVALSAPKLQALLDSNAQRIVRPEEADELDLTDFVQRGFLHFSETLRYRIELGEGPEAARATNVNLHGRPLADFDEETIYLLVGDYVGSGNQGWRGQSIGMGLPAAIEGFDLAGQPAESTGYMFRNLVVNYLREHGAINEETGARLDDRVKVIP